MTLRRATALVVATLLLAALAIAAWTGVEGWGRYRPMDRDESPRDAAARTALLDGRLAAEARYGALFAYFLRGFVDHATADGARVQYPGMASRQGYAINGLEGFARTAPLLAAWIHSGRGTTVVEPGTGIAIDLVATLRRGILAGTDPRAAGYWGPIGDRDQRIVEAADVARVLWLTRGQIWDRLTPAEQDRIAAWLRQVDTAAVWPNNWRLLPVVVDVALQALGRTQDSRRARYAEFKQSYAGHGWFFDRPGVVDFYNAWGVDYDLYWIRLMQPTFDREFIAGVLRDSALLTAYLIGPQGVPILGRSVCYRTAIPVPLLAGIEVEGAPVTPGVARRALDAVWSYFVAHGSLRNGALTQGYLDPDPRVVDAYTGTGSCHWGLRSLVLAYMQPADAPFWVAPTELLPIERGDYHLELPDLGWTVDGRRDTAEIVVRIARNRGPNKAPQAHPTWRQLAEQVLRRPLRPPNRAAQYDSPEYSSATPFPLLPSP
jgi:hypothetical protein